MANIIIKKPSDCSESELDDFEALVKKGDEVTTEGLRNRIMQAEWLVFLFETNQTLAGVAALKNPNVGYKTRVFTKAKSQEDPNKFPFEAGWVYVEKQYRGRKHSHSLLEVVLKLAGDQCIYATTKEKNEFMHRTNIHCGLKQSGQPYPSEKGDYKIILYTRCSPQ